MSRVVLRCVLSGIAILATMFSRALLAQYPQMVYPMDIGNRWQYVEVPPTYSETRVVGDTVMPNGLKYVSVIGEVFGGFYRKENAKVYKCDPLTNIEFVSYDFSKKSGDTVAVYASAHDTVVVTVYEDGLATLFGQQRRYMKFLSKSATSSMYGIYTITDNIGLTAYQGEVFSLYLAGAVISGVQYGVVSHVPIADHGLPSRFDLSQNYPNPFNPTTTIKYELPKSSEVTLSVYDVLGREVAVLVNEGRNAGVHEVKFDGSGFASGVYFYRLRAGDFVQTKRFVLLK